MSPGTEKEIQLAQQRMNWGRGVRKNIQLKLKISVSGRERSREGKGTAHPRRIQDKRDTVTGSTRRASVLVERCRKGM